MNFLSLIPIFSTLIDRLFPDKAKADEAKIAMQEEMNKAAAAQAEANAKQVVAQSEVIKTEMATTNWAGNWRAYMMVVCTAIVANNWILIPLLSAFHLPVIATPIPPELWTLVTVGLGGYIGKETISNYSANKYSFNDKKYFDVVKRLFPQGMSQQQVDILNEAKNEAQQ